MMCSYRHTPGLRGFRFILVVAALFGFCVFVGCNESEKQPPILDQARQSFAAGHYGEAERLYEHFIQSEPQGDERWEAWNRLLDMALTVRQDPNRATTILDAMYLEFGDQGGKAYELLSKLAEVHESMDQHAKAMEAWKKCLSLPGINPADVARIHYRIARNHQAMKAYALASQELSICISDAQTAELAQQCRYTLAQNHMFMGSMDQAKEILDALMSDSEADEERRALAAFLLADILEDQERYADAIRILESIRLSYPNPRVVETRLEHLRSVKP